MLKHMSEIPLSQFEMRLAFFARVWVDKLTNKKYQTESISFVGNKSVCVLREMGGTKNLVYSESFKD